ncbi:TetR/AcrR family transcriptional regulator [Ammoniphilus sp. CFH 90114]|uniref:TetR/AcrR family transcriptional regulator n=1 Tax=Ammoniphilus sp. CFH 90114 TaxID=2493665 RepID=UPI00100FCBBD|nr:TetR/AcrR family transcriptional regulator [Ammoniphilus sp. CFH 90114]RXT14012.1 TetR/AcrR family transcriptional regulator [Ammoniphilus sp. CFH 90114]
MDKKEEVKEDGRHLRSQQTRQRLLKAAREVFLEEGFHKATVSQIIKRAKTGYGTAYVHFSGKDELLIVLMDDVMEKFYHVAEFPFQPSTKEDARRMIEDQVFQFLKLAEPERSMLQVFEEAIGYSDEARHKWKEIRERFIERISQDVYYAQQSGLARMDVDYKLVARSWFFTGEMNLWEIVRNEHRTSVEEIAKTLTAIYTGGLYK